jgi:hypothetical protein
MRALPIVALCLYSSVVFADTDINSGNFYLPACKKQVEHDPNASTTQAYGEGACVGIVTALIALSPYVQQQFRFCAPPAGTIDQAINVAIRYMEAHPRVLDQSFLLLADLAFVEAWPCK